jgi:hypothetical protein
MHARPPRADDCATRIPRLDLCLLLLAVLAVGLPYLRSATFELDDHRFLALLQDIEAGEPGALGRAVLVENRWDDSWWIEDGTFVRFLRPLNIATYAFDRAVWGINARAFTATNLLLHAAATVLLFALLRRVVRGRIGPLVGALAFAAHACHGEVLHFVAGRQGSITCVLVLAVFVLYARGGDGPRRGCAIGALILLSLLGKELAVLPLSLLPLLHRALLAPDARSQSFAASVRARPWTHGAALLAVLAYLVLRHLALGEGGSGARPFPYFHLPGREGFAARTAAVAWQYACGLALGSPVRPFLSDLQLFLDERSWPELGLGAAVPLLLIALTLRRPMGRWFALLTLVSLVPLLPLYSTGRYLYLPSVGWCGLLALLVQAVARSRRAVPRLAGGALLLALVATPAARHGDVLATRPAGAPLAENASRPQLLVEMVRAAALPLDGERPVYLVDFPGIWIEVQFLSQVLQVALGRGLVPVRVLGRLPDEPAPLVELRRSGPDAIDLHRAGRPLHLGNPRMDFDQRVVVTGQVIAERGYTVTVLAEDAGRATRVRVRFDRPLEDVAIYRGAFSQQTRSWGLEAVQP